MIRLVLFNTAFFFCCFPKLDSIGTYVQQLMKPNEKKNYSYRCSGRENIAWVFFSKHEWNIYHGITQGGSMISWFQLLSLISFISNWFLMVSNDFKLISAIEISYSPLGITSNISYQTRRSSQFYLILSY